MIEGNYDRYLEVLRQGIEPCAPEPPPKRPDPVRQSKSRSGPKRKFPYRKTTEIEAEIAEHEQDLARIEHRLADPALYRDGEGVRAVRSQYDSLKSRLAELYKHWEEALDLNG